jgi:leucyl aminopeptidase
MKLRYQYSSLRDIKADIAAVFVYDTIEQFRSRMAHLNQLTGNQLEPFREAGDFRGKEGEMIVVYTGKGFHFRRLLVVGLGDRKKITLEKIRRAAAGAAKRARGYKIGSLAIEMIDYAIVKEILQCPYTDVVQALSEGAALSLYTYDKYITQNEKKGKKIASLIIFNNEKRHTADGTRGAKNASVLCDTTFLARDLENAPANEIYPETLARISRSSARRYRYKARVFDTRKIKQIGMGGLLAVNQGSAKPPRFIILEYGRKNKKTDTIVLVGKGITFDSGGISIKPSAGMAEMKMDMSGAAAVIGTLEACARLKLAVHLVGLIPATENMPGGRALKPGDIIRHYNGITTEVDNTDAEGRLILADALAYASTFKPDAIIDLATLTGACVVALGHHATGMIGTSEELMARLTSAGEKTYERVWRLPLFDEYEKQIKSDIADVKNTGGRWGGAITAAWFLKKFIAKYPWVHLDIAGTAMVEEPSEYISKGGTGVGVRLLIEMLRHWKRLR